MGSAAAEEHLVHGMGKALETPTWPAITDAEAARVLTHFPEAGQFQGLAWHSPRPFSSATRLQTDRGHFFLKRHHRDLRSPDALAEEQGFMAHLQSKGVPVPEVIQTVDGLGAVSLGHWTYELQRKAPGLDLYQDRQSWTPYLKPAHADAAGSALGLLHRAAQDYQANERGPHPLVASFTILPARDPLVAAAAYVAARPALAAFLSDKPWQDELTRLFATFGEGLAERLEDQPALWTHNDWHPSNLLWAADGSVSAVFDFGLAGRTCAVHDLATAIERAAIPWLEIAEGDQNALPDTNAVRNILAGYQREMPLDTELLVRLLPLVHLEFALSEVDYFAGVVGDRDQADLAWQGYAIGHADWFRSAAGQDFIDQLAHWAEA